MEDRMEEKRCSVCVPRAPDCFSINSKVSLKTGKEKEEGIKTWENKIFLKKLRFVAHYACYTLTWRHGIDAVEEKLSSVQYRGGQGLIAVHFSLKTLTTRPLNHIILSECESK